jgi:hypothetical protein
MRIFYVSLLGATLLALTVFTLFGETLYKLGKPVILSTERAGGVFGRDGVAVDAKALRSDAGGDYVYVLKSERGYSLVLYTVSRVAVEVMREYGGVVFVTDVPGGVRMGDTLVIEAEGELRDGVRVIR